MATSNSELTPDDVRRCFKENEKHFLAQKESVVAAAPPQHSLTPPNNLRNKSPSTSGRSLNQCLYSVCLFPNTISCFPLLETSRACKPM